MKGKASPTSLSAALALAVKITVDPGGALKNERTAARAVAVSAADNFELRIYLSTPDSEGSAVEKSKQTLDSPSGYSRAQRLVRIRHGLR